MPSGSHVIANQPNRRPLPSSAGGLSVKEFRAADATSEPGRSAPKPPRRASAQRHYRNALHELERFQAPETEEIAEETAPARDSDPEPARPTPHNTSPKSENGFLPQLTPGAPAASPPDPLLR